MGAASSLDGRAKPLDRWRVNVNQDADLARSILQTRKFPAQEFDDSLFGDVAWDRRKDMDTDDNAE